jgi:hypothetical protein
MISKILMFIEHEKISKITSDLVYSPILGYPPTCFLTQEL